VGNEEDKKRTSKFKLYLLIYSIPEVGLDTVFVTGLDFAVQLKILCFNFVVVENSLVAII